MDKTQKLIELFREFPGIGPRQAKRFVYFLLGKENGYSAQLAKLISEIKSEVTICQNCFRFFQKNGNGSVCKICSDHSRDNSSLMIVANDIDFENIEKIGLFKGYYFILGGTVPILEKNPEDKIRKKELLNIIEKMSKNGLKEIIIAVSYNPEGENTISYIKEIIKDISETNHLKISSLGRGLSTGTEIEYSDSDTIKNALKNRQ